MHREARLPVQATYVQSPPDHIGRMPQVCRRKLRPAQHLQRKSDRLLALFELFGRQLMTRQELVEVRSVALGEARRLTHVAAGDLQDLRQVAARELVAGLVEGGETARSAAE